MNSTDLVRKAQLVTSSIETAVVGKREVIEIALAVLISNGHLLIEDIPGVGKTTLAKALARALGLSFKRIQFTPDLLPSDITGSSIFNQKTGEFQVRPGPVFANIVLADEINRTTPKTQSALLECMEERQVTIDGDSEKLPDPFFVIATQNNIELAGTYPLPEAQLDRFAARLTIGHPNRDAEIEILTTHRHLTPVDNITPAMTIDEIRALQRSVRDIHVDRDVRDYIVDIVRATRDWERGVMLGASPRGSLSLLFASQARAALKGQDHVEPDDVKELAPVTLAHRIIIRPEYRIKGVTGKSVVDDVVNRMKVPLGTVR